MPSTTVARVPPTPAICPAGYMMASPRASPPFTTPCSPWHVGEAVWESGDSQTWAPTPDVALPFS